MQRVIRNLWSFLNRIARPLKESFLPNPRYLTGETVQQVIQMAGYRVSVPRWMGIAGVCIVIPSVVIFLLTLIAGTQSAQFIAGGLSIAGILLLFEAAKGWLFYNQWKFIVTDKRIILITPDPERSWFADAIYLKGGKIQVLDTNFSKNPVWGFFQLTLGTRDVMLSMTGYEFKETGAQVKGGLRFPDVRPEDILRLEELIFS